MGAKKFRATHQINHNWNIYRVMADEDNLYTREEWDNYENAYFTLVDGEVLFMGQPFNGSIVEIPKYYEIFHNI